MTTQITTEERLFRDASTEFTRERAGIPATRALFAEGRTFDGDAWAQAAELGWTALLVPEDLGGGSPSGEGVIDLEGVAELVGESVSPGPLAVVSVAIAGLVHPAATGEHEDVLEGLVAGELVATWAVHGPGAAWDLTAPGVTATPTADGWTLNGEARAVEFGADADVLLVAATTPDGIIEVRVGADAAGLEATPTGSVDLVRHFATVRFDGVAVPREALVADEENSAEVLAHQAAVMNLLQCAEAVGAIRKVFQITVEWGFDRYSFGRPLVSYQALKHRYSDMMTWLYACQAITRGAARALQNGDADAARLVSIAKSYVGDQGVKIVQDCCQIHGAISQTTDHDLHIYLRRVMLARQLYGTPREHRALLADHLLGKENA